MYCIKKTPHDSVIGSLLGGFSYIHSLHSYAFMQTVLLMSVFEKKIKFSNVLKSRRGSQDAVSSAMGL